MVLCTIEFVPVPSGSRLIGDCPTTSVSMLRTDATNGVPSRGPWRRASDPSADLRSTHSYSRKL